MDVTGSWLSRGGSVIDVLRMAKTASGRPVLVRSIPVAGEPLGETITPDGKYLLAADGNGAVVISVARAESGAASVVLGTLAAPGGSGNGQGALSASAIEVATSRDGRYAFVTLEYDQRAAVFNLAGALSRGFGSADYVGSIPLGQAAVGLAVSPDGRWLYATSEGASPCSASGGHQGVAWPERAGALRRSGRPRWDSAQRAAGHADADRPAGGRRPTPRTRSWPPSMPAASRSA